MASFEKLLTTTDVKKRLAIPTRCLPYFERPIEGSHAVHLKVKDDKGRLMTMSCTTRKKGYKKPVLTSGWLLFVRRKKLKVGDKIIFRQSEDGVPVYVIEAQRRIAIMGQDVWSNVSDE